MVKYEKMTENVLDSAYEALWEDREVKFDLGKTHLRPRAGEFVIDRLEAIEDTKGNNGSRGRLIITNLRLIWHSVQFPKINLSIGLNTVLNINKKFASSKLRGGETEALYLLTKFNNTKFEFIFTNLIPGSPKLYTTVYSVHRAYETTKLYRELKLRSAILDGKELMLLPLEQMFERIDGVWNLSNDQGNLGLMYVTNVRIVWHATPKSNFNVSVPWVQIKNLKVRNSRFGPALVIESSRNSGGYVLGFKIDPEDRLGEVLKELLAYYETYYKKPQLGIEYVLESTGAASGEETKALENLVDDVEIETGNQDTLAAYYSAGMGSEGDAKREVIYSESLGLAIEKPKEGFTIESLWQIN